MGRFRENDRWRRETDYLLDKDEKVVTTYILLQTIDQLKADKEIFNKTFTEKLSQN